MEVKKIIFEEILKEIGLSPEELRKKADLSLQKFEPARKVSLTMMRCLESLDKDNRDYLLRKLQSFNEFLTEKENNGGYEEDEYEEDVESLFGNWYEAYNQFLNDYYQGNIPSGGNFTSYRFRGVPVINLQKTVNDVFGICMSQMDARKVGIRDAKEYKNSEGKSYWIGRLR